MARDLTPILKRSRREQTALHPKAIKGLTKRPTKPGQHGPNAGRSKPSQYAIQLRQKQMVKRMYGLLEKQFVRLVNEAERRTGNTGDVLIELLERRLDNAVYRLGLAPSRQAARQLVTHGHFMLNGRRVDIPSISLKSGDSFTVRPKSAANAYFKHLADAGIAKDALSWMSFDAKKLTAKVTSLPSRQEVTEEINEQLIIEFYSR
ncbi:30S ribosomal protein S4 [bacterium]|nr:MAG: 30S ribosomal protein S4 [bacterium]